MKDFYYILGTEVNCTSLEIKEAYRKLSKKFHPDLNFNDKYFENHFREIKEAYDTLSNPVKRSEYDKKLNKFRLDPSYQQYAENLKRREEELRKREEKIRFRQAFPHYYNSRKYPGAENRSPTRKVDVGFTLVLIIITFVFGNYVMNVVKDSKTATTTKPAPVFSTASVIIPVHHKKKRKTKFSADSDSNTVDIAAQQPPVSETISTENKPAAAQTQVVSDESAEVKPMAVDYKKPKPKDESNFLYATNVVSNVTGVTNMRETDRYSSPVIKEIPSNSKVFVIKKGTVFYKVLCDNETGYVPKWTLEDK